jgi:hypothetical protein
MSVGVYIKHLTVFVFISVNTRDMIIHVYVYLFLFLFSSLTSSQPFYFCLKIGQKLFFDSRREYRVTRKNDSILIVGGLAVVVVGAGAQYALTAYESYQAKRVIAEVMVLIRIIAMVIILIMSMVVIVTMIVIIVEIMMVMVFMMIMING